MAFGLPWNQSLELLRGRFTVSRVLLLQPILTAAWPPSKKALARADDAIPQPRRRVILAATRIRSNEQSLKLRHFYATSEQELRIEM